MIDLKFVSPWVACILLLGCAESSPDSVLPDEQPVQHEAFPRDKVSHPVSQVAPLGVPVKTRRVAVTASGDDEESAESTPTESSSRGNVSLEPEVWDPHAFHRPRRRMTVEQIDQAVKDVTGGIGWEDGETCWESCFISLAPSLGVPDYFRRTKLDLTPGMTFQKFLSDGANVVCSTLINHEQNISAEERVFFVHIEPGTNPVNAPSETDANIQMLLLRFHGKAYALDAPGMEPWRNLVNTIAGNAGPQWGAWLEAWTAMCVALMKHPDFYSY